jgi:predicted nucleic acid-binding protein
MIVLDANVISELFRPAPNDRVRSLGASLATRNTRDFKDCGVALIDPWQ